LEESDVNACIASNKRELQHINMLSAYINRAKSNLRNGKSRTPLLFEDIKTNASITINVGMKDLGPKCNLKRV